MTGKVYLVGAGPGDPGLITEKGLELIKRADCIIYDRLMPTELLEYARADCECIYVGKADSHHTLPQEEINELLCDMAHIYGTVVRLKGGDSFVFGRGAEEALYLKKKGIDFKVIPGVSSAIAGAEAAGIPVTHRGIASSFRVVTAHRRIDGTAEIDYSTMLDAEETLVFLMGLNRVEEITQRLINAGRSPDTPVAVVSHGTMPDQRVCIGSLSSIAADVKKQQLTSPAIIIAGDVVTLRPRLRYLEKQSLFGKNYLVPKLGREPSRLAELLREKGAGVTEVMVGKIVGVPAVYTCKSFERADLFIFTSANGVKYFMRNIFASGLDARALGSSKIVAIGPKTAEKLKEYGLRADLIPERYNGRALAEEIKDFADRNCNKTPFERVQAYYPAAKNAGDELVDTLLEFCECGRLNVYDNVPCEFVLERELAQYDGIFFTSASCAERLLKDADPDMLSTLGIDTTIFSIGPTCSARLSELAVTPISESAVSTYEGLLNTALKR